VSTPEEIKAESPEIEPDDSDTPPETDIPEPIWED